MTHHPPSTNTTDLPAGYRLTELGPLPEEWRVVWWGCRGEALLHPYYNEDPSNVLDAQL